MTRAPERLSTAQRSVVRRNPLLQTLGREGERLKVSLLHPVRSVPLAFLAVIIIGAGILMLPISRAGEVDDLVTTAFFTAVSSVCVTGLITVDTATFWTPFGHGVILMLIQVGGFGIMSLASLLALFVRKTIGLRCHHCRGTRFPGDHPVIQESL